MAIVYDEVQRVFGLHTRHTIYLCGLTEVYSGEMLMQDGIRIPPLKGDYWSYLYHIKQLL